ncbi:DUF3052 family protein [Streptomyces avidinii]|uniref:DUF3052 family protein n=1 Tax=Streptomyces avidinii TaxID=1895 RepID=UPI0037A60047
MVSHACCHGRAASRRSSPAGSDGLFGKIRTGAPKAGRDGYVEPSETAEAATRAGLTRSTGVSAGADWNANRMLTPKGAAKQR